jgi:N-acetylneuraminate epimerase
MTGKTQSLGQIRFRNLFLLIILLSIQTTTKVEESSVHEEGENVNTIQMDFSLVSNRSAWCFSIKRMLLSCIVTAVAAAMFAGRTVHADTLPRLQFAQLSPLPPRFGLAGTFAGTSHGTLIVAGGANFPDRPPWEGGRKVWHDDIHVLEQPNGKWKTVGKLPRPLAYGMALSTADGVVCIGGSDSARHYAEAFVLSWQGGRLTVRHLPPLPQAIANASGGLIGDTIYLAGGTASPDATKALDLFLSFNLSQSAATWQSLPSWPGRERMMACTATCEGAFYLMSGVCLTAASDGRPVRSYLRDAYRYMPGGGWKRIDDLPRAAAAVASPAPVWGATIILLGGDDGSKLNFQPPAAHSGFATDAIAYNVKFGRWSNLGPIPVSRVNLPAVSWHETFILPSGEVRPGVRSPEVWSLKLHGVP